MMNRRTILATSIVVAATLCWVAAPVGARQGGKGKAMKEVRFMTLDPGHFHAGLVQKEMYPNVSNKVHVYAPLGPDLIEHLNRIVLFNTRKENPTSWQLEIHTGPDFLQRMFQERPGNVVVLSGRNQGKIDRIKASVEAGLNVLADKPWVIDPADFPKLEAALNTADQKQLIAYDIMTERFEITTILQRELVNDRDTFGAILPGSEKEPSVYMKSVHHLLKLVAGVPNRRPAWFFDVKQQGEAVPDVGTHLIDLAQWILFPNQALDYRKDVKVTAARRWPTVLTLAEFQKVTGEGEFPGFLRTAVRDGKLEYYCNGSVTYALRGVFVKLEPLWNYEAPAGAGDTHDAWVKGSRSRIEIRQGAAEKWKPELYVVPNAAADRPAVAAALAKKISSIQATYPGVAFRDQGADFRVEIPDKYRVGHEPHFAQVTGNFLRYLDDPSKLPAWEKPDMLVKYYISTKALELSTH